MIYELLRGFTPSTFLPPIPTTAYWSVGIALLLIAPFLAFLKEQRRADIYESLCKQVFEETFVFLNYGKESRRVPKTAIDEGTQVLDEIGREVRSGNFARAGMVVPLFHEMYNLFLDFYGGSTQGTADYLRRTRAIVDKVLEEGFSNRAISAQLRSESYETFRQRWEKGRR